jgi:hypothetical protein
MANELILTLNFETPPPADELGEVFAALGRDYRDSTKGRVLVVTSVRDGSIIATLTDLALTTGPYVAGGVATLAAVNSLTTFAKNLKEWFGKAKSDHGKKRLYRKGKKAPGQRSVEAIIKTAATTGSHVHVKHTSANGETLEAELTPVEALSARAQLSAPEAKADEVPMKRILSTPREVQVAIERLHQAGISNLSTTEAQAVVDVVVAVLLASGAGHLLPEIASDLEIKGLHNFADAVRQHIRPSGSTHEPPLTTT